MGGGGGFQAKRVNGLNNNLSDRTNVTGIKTIPIETSRRKQIRHQLAGPRAGGGEASDICSEKIERGYVLVQAKKWSPAACGSLNENARGGGQENGRE